MASPGSTSYRCKRWPPPLKTPRSRGEAIFDSEITVSLYVLPALLAGIGIHVTSHVLLQHLTDAQRRFARTHDDPVNEEAFPEEEAMP